ncbi:MAG: segregation/condensation protein A [Myxococcota bacterium]|nr:segregation/condensation protein A [Myxococcota bacterium]
MSTPGESSTADPSPEAGGGQATERPVQQGATTQAGPPDTKASHGPWAVKLEVFEGPLDLLLHLIRQNDLDIEDIPIAILAEQYLEYLELMRELDVDVAAEYLLMAATLAQIKSRMLLPLHEEEGENEEDPRAELARRLAEYASFKEVARELADREWLNRDVFAGSPDPAGVPAREAELSVSLFGLLEALKKVLDQAPVELHAHEVTRETITLQDQMLFVMDELRAASGDPVVFEELLSGTPLTRVHIVLTFLAILELAKIQALRLYQHTGPEGHPSGPVRVRVAVLPEPPSQEPDERPEETEPQHDE